MGCAVDLIVVVVEASDASASELGNLAGGTANTTTNIKNLHALLHVHSVREVVLVAGDSLVERLADGEAAEVERLSPSIFVQVGRQVVVAGYTVNNCQHQT